jgi:putative DNA primase/helicase
VNWRPLFGRDKVLLWPDADEPGLKAMSDLGKMLADHCKEVKLINPSDMPDGWDAADAVEGGMPVKEWAAWARRHVTFLTEVKPVKPAPVRSEHVIKDKPKGKQKDRPVPEDGRTYTLYTEKNGIPSSNQFNVGLVLKHEPMFKGHFWYDEFLDMFLTSWRCEKPKPWDDASLIELTSLMQGKFRLSKVSASVVENGMKSVANHDIRNTAQDFVKSCVWDGTARLETFFIDFCGAEDSEFVRAVSRNFFIGMVARIMKPGVKFDNILILEGLQGVKKSTLFEALGGEFYSILNEDPNSKDAIISTIGKFLVELPELDFFQRASEAKKKGLLATRIDRYRPVYGKTPIDRPRSFIWVGTTNDDDYLSDLTGNRRYWPIQIERVMLDEVKDNRSNLFAEALQLYSSGSTWWEVPDSAADEQDARVVLDPWEEAIFKQLNGLSELRSISTLMDTLGIPPERQSRSISNRIGRILRHNKWKKTVKRDGDFVTRVWKKQTNLVLIPSISGDFVGENRANNGANVGENQEKMRKVFNHATGEWVEISLN